MTHHIDDDAFKAWADDLNRLHALEAENAALRQQLVALSDEVHGEDGTYTFGDGDIIKVRKGPSWETLRQQLATVTAERDAYRQAKAENDERYMIERDEARHNLTAANEQVAVLEKAIAAALELEAMSGGAADTLAPALNPQSTEANNG